MERVSGRDEAARARGRHEHANGGAAAGADGAA